MATTLRRTAKENAKLSAVTARRVQAAVDLLSKTFPALRPLCGEESRKVLSVSRDTVNHPAHYNAGKFEVIDVIEDWQLGFHLGNTVKYIARAKHKGSELEDLRKAAWYLNRKIKTLEG